MLTRWRPSPWSDHRSSDRRIVLRIDLPSLEAPSTRHTRRSRPIIREERGPPTRADAGSAADRRLPWTSCPWLRGAPKPRSPSRLRGADAPCRLHPSPSGEGSALRPCTVLACSRGGAPRQNPPATSTIYFRRMKV